MSSPLGHPGSRVGQVSKESPGTRPVLWQPLLGFGWADCRRSCLLTTHLRQHSRLRVGVQPHAGESPVQAGSCAGMPRVRRIFVIFNVSVP